MSNGTKKDFFGGMLPAAAIKTITLENGGYTHVKREPHITGLHPEYLLNNQTAAVQSLDTRLKEFQNPIGNTSKNLKTTLHISINEKVTLKNKKVFTSWLGKQQFTKWIKIVIVQSPSAAFTRDLIMDSSTSPLWDYILYHQQYGNLANQRIKDGTFGSPLQTLNDEGHIKTFSLGDIASSVDAGIEGLSDVQALEKFNSFIDSNGNKNYEIPFRTSFEFGNDNPNHLSYFVVTFLDINEMGTEMGFDPSDVISDLSINDICTITHEIAIDNSNTPATEKIFKTKTGEVWTGPVHQMPDGRWMQGDSHNYKKASSASGDTSLQEYLTVLTANNTKIQDFRHVDIPEKNIIKDLYAIEKPITELTKYTSIYDEGTILPEYGRKYFFSTISRNTDGNCSIFFSINWIVLLYQKTLFPSFYASSLTQSAKAQQVAITINSFMQGGTGIKYLKLYRRRVKHNIAANKLGHHSGYEEYYEDEAPELVASWPNAAVDGIESIKEMQNIGPKDSPAPWLRHFTVTDPKISGFNDGLFEYQVEVEIADPVYKFFRALLDDLHTDKEIILEYYRASMMRGGNNNMPYYDAYLNKFTQPFVDLYSQSTPPQPSALAGQIGEVTLSDSTNPIRKQIENYGNALLFLTPAGSEIRQQIANKINTITNTTSGSPSGIEKFMNMHDELMTNLLNLSGMNRATNKKTPLGAKNLNQDVIQNIKTSNKSRNLAETIKYTESLKSFYDASQPKNIGYDYLSPLNQEASEASFNGMKVISRIKFNQRISQETLKYYATDDGVEFNFSGPNTTQPYISADNLNNSKISYLTPSYARIGDWTLTNTSPMHAASINDNSPKNNYHRDLLLRLVNYNSSGDVDSEYNYNPKSTLSEPEQMAKRKLIELFSDLGATVNDVAPPIMSEVEHSADILAGTVPTLVDTAAIGHSAEIQEQSFDIALDKNKNSNMLLFKLLGKEIFSEEDDYSIERYDLQSEKNILQSIVDNNLDAGIQTRLVQNLPNQIKYLLLETGQNANPGTTLAGQTGFFQNGKDPRKDLRNYGIFWMNFENIVEIEYWNGFGLDSTGQELFSTPKWEKLTNSVYAENSNQSLLCRLKRYENSESGVRRHKKLDLPIYNEYFILAPELQIGNITAILGAAAGN